MTSLPSYIDLELWSAFVSQRQAMKVPFTPQAQKLVIMKLMKFHSEGYDANAALEKAAIYGYRSVFVDDTMRMKKDRPAIDPALAKIQDDAKRAVKPPPEILAKLKEMTR